MKKPRMVWAAVLASLGGFLLAGSLSEWRAVNPEGLFSAAFHSVAMLAFFWACLLFLAERVSQLLATLERKAPGWLVVGVKSLAALAVSFGWVVMVASLATRQAIGCFLNLPLLQFAWVNITHGLWTHMVKSQRWMLAALLFFLALTSAWVWRQVFRYATQLNWWGRPAVRKPLLLVALSVAVAFSLSAVALNGDMPKAARTRLMAHLSYKLDPLLTFGLSCLDFYHQMAFEQAVLEESRLTPLLPVSSQPTVAMPEKPNLIFLQIDSLRADLIGQVWQGREICPHLTRLARYGTRFTRAYAPGTHTSLSKVSIPSSLYPLRKDMLVAYSDRDPYPKILIYDVLKPHGYATAWISSDIESWCGMRDFLQTPALDVVVDAVTQELRRDPRMAPEDVRHVHLAPDRLTMASALDWMAGRIKEQQPFYLTINLMDSHFPYDTSFTNANWFTPCGVPKGSTFNNYPRAKALEVKNSYLNAIHGADLLAGELMDFLQQQAIAARTILVVFGDHGESLYENNIPTHANLPYDSSARTALLMVGTNYFSPGTEDYPTSLIDVVPTVLARLGLPLHPNFQGLDVLATNRPPLARRCVYVRVDGMVNGDAVVAMGRWKFIQDNSKGNRFLYDLLRDPGERVNLAESQPAITELLQAQLNRYRAGQLAYYRLDRYYTRFYPPKPPLLID